MEKSVRGPQEALTCVSLMDAVRESSWEAGAMAMILIRCTTNGGTVWTDQSGNRISQRVSFMSDGHGI